MTLNTYVINVMGVLMLLHIKEAQCPKSAILTIINAQNNKTIALLEITRKAAVVLFHCPSHGHTQVLGWMRNGCYISPF